VVTSDQLPFNIYCINADEVGGQSFLTSANNCWVVAGQDTKGVVSFFLTPATASAGVLTIASGSTLFQQNVTGLCPQACDIVALLGSDNPGSLTYSNPASATVNASVAAFAAQNSNSFNAYQINAGIINNIYKDNPNTTVILMYTMAENNFAVIFYQGFVFDADPGDGGLTATSKTYLDPNPVMLLKASISNP
jgi:hypothetical protein